MSEEFKRRLAQYEKGELSGEELEEFEKELEKLEKYQEYLEESENQPKKKMTVNEKKQQKILRRSKWKARVQTALTALGLIFIFTFVSTILTAIYYQWGEPDREEVLRGVIDHTPTVTNPYGNMGGTGMSAGPYFGMVAERELKKQVGYETVRVGKMKVRFFLSMMFYPVQEEYGRKEITSPSFRYPDPEKKERYFRNGERIDVSDWDRLEKLPEGTVASAWLSFTELIETEKVFELFEDRDLEILWLAVDTGLEEEREGPVFEPIGFPGYPIWHEDDMILDSREEKKGFLGFRVVSEEYSSPEYEAGDQAILHQQFLKTLYFLKDHERKANKLVFEKLELAKRIDYLEKNGFRHYGVVITGPTKEVLKLKEELWAAELVIDEVGFWNWH